MSWSLELKNETHQQLREQHNGFLDFLERIIKEAHVKDEIARATASMSGLTPPFVAKVDRWGSVPFTPAGVSLGMDQRHDVFGTKLADKDGNFAQRHTSTTSRRPAMATRGFVPDR